MEGWNCFRKKCVCIFDAVVGLLVATANWIGRSSLRVGIDGGVVYDSVVEVCFREVAVGLQLTLVKQVRNVVESMLIGSAVMRRPLQRTVTATINANGIGGSGGTTVRRRRWRAERGW